MLLKFRCPLCDRKLESESSLGGCVAYCPVCGSPVAVPEPAVRPGVVVGGCRLQELIGHGGMGQVYLATQLSMERPVAVKILPAGLGRNSALMKRFSKEVLIIAGLNHPNIVTVHDAGVDDGVPYLVMNYIDGEPLDVRVKREGRIPESEALRIVREIASALDYAWDRQGVLHRDVKPSNIMVDGYGEVKLLDLGLAKTPTDDEDMTAVGIAMGTPSYMSPEQARGSRRADHRSDMYSLGATLYHLVTGKPPFTGQGAVDILTRQVLDPLPSPRDLNPDLSSPCVHLLRIMLAKKAECRHPDWPALIRDIDRVLSGVHPEAPLPGPDERVSGTARKVVLADARRVASRFVRANLDARLAATRKPPPGPQPLWIVFIVTIVLLCLAVLLLALRIHYHTG